MSIPRPGLSSLIVPGTARNLEKARQIEVRRNGAAAHGRRYHEFMCVTADKDVHVEPPLKECQRVCVTAGYYLRSHVQP